MAVQNGGVRMILPSSLGGGDVASSLRLLGFRGCQNPDGSWNVRPSTASPELVKTLTLGAPWISERKFDLLNGYSGHQDEDSAKTAQALYDKFDALLKPRRAVGDLTAWLYRAQTAVMAAADSKIASIADCADATTIGKLADSNGELLFPGHSCHAVIFGKELYSRSKLPQVLIGFDQDPQLLADLSNAAAMGQPSPGELPVGQIFDSNTAILLQSLTLGDNYLAPLLGCCSPRIWAIVGQRMYTVILFVLGNAWPGIESTPVESLQLLPHAWAFGKGASPHALQAKSCAEAIDWWGLKLQKMFEYLTDPTYFRDSSSNYLPYLHQNWMMTVGQLFQRLGSIATSYRDVYAQQVLTFGAVDAIGDRLYSSGSQMLYRPTRARAALETVRASIKDPAAKLLLPHAERAVAALAEIQDGFFIRKRRGISYVGVVTSGGTVEHWDIDHATKEFLVARRNATHGFGHPKAHDADNVRILAHHNGELPRDLVYLPYLYLLEMLCTPEKIIDTIREAGDKAA
jgi:hypothetical protein